MRWMDGAVRRIQYEYDDVSRTRRVTSYNASTGGSVVNEVARFYDGWGNISYDYQNHAGAVNDHTQAGTDSPAFQYVYETGAVSGEASYLRISKVIYPSGEDYFYLYPTSGVGEMLNRVDSIANDSSGTIKYAQWGYIGVGTIVTESRPQVSGGLVLDLSQSQTYAGWDRFMRIIDQKWRNSAGTTNIDRFGYGYDRDSNRVWKDVNPTVSTTGKDEYYTYDGLVRLTSWNRGDLASGSISDASANYNQKWTTLDSVGNCSSSNMIPRVAGTATPRKAARTTRRMS
jgi:hypothetical protein